MKPETTGEIIETEDMVNDSREMMLKAGQEAEMAKAAARQAISQAFQQTDTPVERTDTPAEPVRQQDNSRDKVELTGQEKLRLANKILNGHQNLLGIISEIITAYFTVNELNAGAKEDFYNTIVRSNPRLEELVNELSLTQARLKTDRTLEEAKSDRIASRLAVQQARDELKKVIEDTGVAVRQAQEEAVRAKSEAQTCRRDAEEAITIARRLVEQARHGQPVGNGPGQSEMERAEAEIRQARAEVAATKAAADLAVQRAEAEIIRHKEETEEVRRQMQEMVVRNRQQNYRDLSGEINRIKAEADAARQAAREGIKKAQEETRKAREEARIAGENYEKNMVRAGEEIRSVREEAEKARRELAETNAMTDAEKRRIKEEAEAAVRQANEALERAREEIIRMTMQEITRTRQELEAVARDPGFVFHEPAQSPAPDVEENVDISEEKLAASLQLEKMTVSPHRFIADAVQEAQAGARVGKFVLLLSIPKTLPQVEIDEKRVKQVLINLIKNAARFSSANNAINIRAEVRNDELLVQVKDHGTGISRSELATIFEKDRATGHGDEGEETGLPVCREIVTAHGGQIWAESLEGQGSIFSFTLPTRCLLDDVV